MKRCQEGEVAGAGGADCIHCLDEGMMSPQYYAGGERSAINVGMYRGEADAAVAQTQNSALGSFLVSRHRLYTCSGTYVVIHVR